jgi:putative ABC transport system substrate-binding protein
MKLRVLLFLGIMMLVLPTGRLLEQSDRVPRLIAFISTGTEATLGHYLAAFRVGMKELGYLEGRDIVIDLHWAQGRLEQLPGIVQGVVASKPDLIVTHSTPALTAPKKTTSSLPIVFGAASDVIEQGFVASLRRPGGNITGVTVNFEEVWFKVPEIAKGVFPSATRIAMLIYEGDPVNKLYVERTLASARDLQFEALLVRAKPGPDFEGAFREASGYKPDALLVPSLTVLSSYRAEIAQLALSHRLPSFSSMTDYALAGGLAAYGPSVEANFHRAAALVDKIFKGAHPGDIPVERPTKFYLLINLKTAKALGLTIPQSMLIRADQVIE